MVMGPTMCRPMLRLRAHRGDDPCHVHGMCIHTLNIIHQIVHLYSRCDFLGLLPSTDEVVPSASPVALSDNLMIPMPELATPLDGIMYTAILMQDHGLEKRNLFAVAIAIMLPSLRCSPD